MDKTVRVGSSPLSLCIVNSRAKLAGVLTMPNGDAHTFWVKPRDLEAALKQLKSARSPRCQRPKKSQSTQA